MNLGEALQNYMIGGSGLNDHISMHVNSNPTRFKRISFWPQWS